VNFISKEFIANQRKKPDIIWLAIYEQQKNIMPDYFVGLI